MTSKRKPNWIFWQGGEADTWAYFGGAVGAMFGMLLGLSLSITTWPSQTGTLELANGNTILSYVPVILAPMIGRNGWPPVNGKIFPATVWQNQDTSIFRTMVVKYGSGT